MTSNPTGPVTAGVDHNYFERITVDVSDFSANNPQVLLRFKSPRLHINLINEGGAVVEYSFNGNTVHGDLATSGLTQEREFVGRQYTKIWFRSSGSSTVRVEIWGE
jgi:hypothetical protein